MLKKIGLTHPVQDDLILINNFLEILQEEKLDFTNTFRNLPTLDLECLTKWKVLWKKRLRLSNIPLETATELMKDHNPSVIPRNHMVEKALQDSKIGKYDALHELLDLIRTPYKDHETKHTLPPKKQGACF